ncbi:MAG TPA: peptidoglycan DD-metalloendopeptidase family protein [Actinomycetota bacterium]|nr:peptidoglycan DD-metalloendopeptidase family protein [Actinomycetota bacterium]
MLRFGASIVLWLVLVPATVVEAAPLLIPPVDAPVAVPFDAPAHRFAPGHRGIDYATPAGTRVRAAASGIVTFAGRVAGTGAVTVAHDSGYESTYTSLGDIEVVRGDLVRSGTWLGTTDVSHPGGRPGLHFAVKWGDRYVDPGLLLGTFDVSAAIHLAPLVWQPPAAMPAAFRSAFADAGTAEPLCRAPRALTDLPSRPPNDNIAVAIAGLSSRTRGGLDADMYEHGPEELGYPPHRVYRFSYAGIDGRMLHHPYRREDTFGDVRKAADGLRRLLRVVALRHPGARVDLFAHSLGGLVARRYLTHTAKLSSQRLPQIEHLVTFATPHRGSILAELPDRLSTETLTGGPLVDGLSALSRLGAPWPDPRSPAVAQLAPGSDLLRDMSRESVIYGTRALALATPNDPVVTADRALWRDARSTVVPPAGIYGHSAIVSSDLAQGVAHAFLRDAAPACRGAWDLWGPRVGRALAFAESQAVRGLAALESLGVGRILRIGRLGRDLTRTRAGRIAGRLAGRLLHRAGVEVMQGR